MNHVIVRFDTGDNKFALSNQEKADAPNSFFISMSDTEDANIPLQVLTIELSQSYLKKEFLKLKQ